MYRFYQTGRIRLVLSIILFALAINMLLPQMSAMIISANGIDVTPDSDFWYDSERLSEIRDMFSQEGKTAYVQTRFTFDFLWPLIYTFFFVSCIGYMMKSKERSLLIQVIYLLPFIAIALDIIENILCSLYFMSIGGEYIAPLASVASSLKWIGIFMVFGIILILLVSKIFTLFRNKIIS